MDVPSPTFRLPAHSSPWPPPRGPMTNSPIKTYAFARVANIFARLAGGASKLSTYVGDSLVAGLEIYGSDSEGLSIADFANELGIDLIDWSLEAGSDPFAALVPSADGTQATVRGLKAGIAYIVANIKEMGRVIIPVEVLERKAEKPDTGNGTTPAQASEHTASYEETSAQTAAASMVAQVASSKGVALAQTGDQTPFVAMVSLMCTGFISLFAGLFTRKRS